MPDILLVPLEKRKYKIAEMKDEVIWHLQPTLCTGGTGPVVVLTKEEEGQRGFWEHSCSCAELCESRQHRIDLAEYVSDRVSQSYSVELGVCGNN